MGTHVYSCGGSSKPTIQKKTWVAAPPLGNLEESEDFGGSYVVYPIHVVDRDSCSKNCQYQLSSLHLESIAIATDVFLEPNGISVGM